MKKHQDKFKRKITFNGSYVQQDEVTNYITNKIIMRLLLLEITLDKSDSDTKFKMVPEE